MTWLQQNVTAPLAVASHDAGAVNLIVHWLQGYKSEVRICTEGPARIIWQKMFPDIKLFPIEEAINSANTLLSGT